MKTLLNSQQIHQGIEKLAGEIQQKYSDRPLMVVGVLNGAVLFLADLIRELSTSVELGFIEANSYRGNATRPGELAIDGHMLPSVRDYDVLILDDIFDTGNTLKSLIEHIRQMEPASVASAVLLKKADRQEVAMEPDFVVFQIPDEFVVGYGMDYNNRYRNLPYIAALEDSDLVE